MYSKPTVQRFGTFREMTLGGYVIGYGDTASYFTYPYTPPVEQPPSGASTS